MIIPHSCENKSFVVLGLGRSGRSAAAALKAAGGDVRAWDDTPKAREAAKLENISLVEAAREVEWSQVDALVLSPGIPHTYPAPHPMAAAALAAGVPLISDIDILFQSQTEAKYVGVTGTNGKSTTTALIGHILKEAGIPVQVGGNIGIPALELDPLGKEGVYVLEMSSYQLEITPHMHFDAAIVLNVTPDHLERHGGVEGYVAAKKRIYEASKKEDLLVLGIDTPETALMVRDAKEKCDVLPISVCKACPGGFDILAGQLRFQERVLLDLKDLQTLRGEHNWQNVAAAVAVARKLSVDAVAIVKALRSFPGLDHRQQRVCVWNGLEFINDSKATNAEAAVHALNCFKDRPLYWLVGGRAKAGGVGALKPLFHCVEHVFVYGEAQEEFALSFEGEVAYTCLENLESAVNAAAQLALKKGLMGSVVLLSPACASFDQFRDFEVRGRAFCDYVEHICSQNREAI